MRQQPIRKCSLSGTGQLKPAHAAAQILPRPITPDLPGQNPDHPVRLKFGKLLIARLIQNTNYYFFVGLNFSKI